MQVIPSNQVEDCAGKSNAEDCCRDLGVKHQDRAPFTAGLAERVPISRREMHRIVVWNM